MITRSGICYRIHSRKYSFAVALIVLLSLGLGGCRSSSSSSNPPPAEPPVTPPSQPVSGDPELGPLISGTAAYIAGNYVWTDYAYDDTGAAGSLALPGGGSASYPDNPHPGNTADLIQLQLSTGEQGELHIKAVMQTLVEGFDALLGVGLDTDLNATTGAASLPGGGWDNDGALGLERLLLLPSNGEPGRLLTWAGDTFVEVARFPVQVNRDDNTISANIDGLRPGQASWNVVAVVGSDDNQQNWFNGNAPIFDLAFVRAEDPVMEPIIALTEQVPQLNRPNQDKRQAAVLAGNEPAALAIATVEFGSQRDELPEVGPGLHTFLYHSRLKLGGGIQQDPLEFHGRYQPYVVLIPEGLEEQAPGIIFLHGNDQNHLVNAVHFSDQGLLIDGFYNVPAVVIFPHGRTANWEPALAEQDMLDATDDAIARLNLDPDRIVLSGISAGGIGTFRHASRYPDRWTGGYSIVGRAQPLSSGVGVATGPATTPLSNMTNLPFRAHNGTLDPLINAFDWYESAQQLADADTVDYHTALVNTTSHLPWEAGNCWYLEMISHPRETNPARVRYTVVPQSFFVIPERGIDLRPRSAYWVTELESRDDNPGSIDATNLAIADRLRVVTEEFRGRPRQSIPLLSPRDFCGPNPDILIPDNWIESGRFFGPGAPQPTLNGIALTLNNLALAELDLNRMGLSTQEPLQLDVVGDGTTELALLGAWQGSLELLHDGQVIDSFPAATERLVITVEEGLYTLRPVGG